MPGIFSFSFPSMCSGSDDTNSPAPGCRVPAQLQAHASLGRAYTCAGQPLRAIPHLKAAAALDPDGRGYYTLSQAYEAAAQKELVREALRKYREISAAHP